MKTRFLPDTKWQQMWSLIENNLIKNPTLCRVPQTLALENTKRRLVEADEKKKLIKGGRPKIFSICTGGGKSIMILLHGIFLCAKTEQDLRKKGIERPVRFLVVCPNLNILNNNFDALDEAKEYGIIPEEVYGEIKRTKGKDGDVTTVESVDYAIMNYQKIGKHHQTRMLSEFDSETFDVVMIDEAHHYNENSENTDTTHIQIAKHFSEAYKLLFTATPYQSLANKNKEGNFEIPPLLPDFDVKNDVIYDYNFRAAWINGYVKQPELVVAKPHEQKLKIYKDECGRIEEVSLHSKEMIKRYAEKLGDKYKSALGRSEKAWINLMGATVDKLQERNSEIPQHNAALIVFRTNIQCNKAKEIFDEIFLKTGFKSIAVNSNLDQKEVEKRIKDIKKDKYDVIFAVQMFNEGFNYPNLNIITFCRNVKSILLFQQLFGRSVRARKDAYGKPINVNDISKPPIDIAYAIANEKSHIAESLWNMFMNFDWKNIEDKEKIECEHRWVNFDEDWYICENCGTMKRKNICMHQWVDYEDYLKCKKCGYIKSKTFVINIDDEKIGDSSFI
ncbi:MAG TPA: DEAD/DEAH box helicase family protein, partial [Candidatus Paceibacterota bacterium]|nr:DEAD/DEAH box helicase family protein [Candidatus Paceibacterota bacterium]